MISKLYASWLACEAIYSQQTDFDHTLTIGPDVIGIKQVGDMLTITPEGSIDRSMWLNNLHAIPTAHPILGDIHSGFLDAAEAIYKAVKHLIVGKVSFQGHSRGAALCNVLASLCALDGIHVDGLFLFECPNVGCQQYADFCTGKMLSGDIEFEISTVNGIDPVPDLPLFPYLPSYPTTQLAQSPGGFLDVDIIDWHVGSTIYAGMQRLFPS